MKLQQKKDKTYKLNSKIGLSNLFLFTYDANITTLDLSNFDTSNVTSVQRILGEMSSLRTVYVGDKWNSINVESNYMFNGKVGYFTLKNN